MPTATWTGTQLGYALTGARLAGGQVWLDWNQYTTDANTMGLWHMNEASWNGTANEVVDSSGNNMSIVDGQTTKWTGDVPAASDLKLAPSTLAYRANRFAWAPPTPV